MQNGERDRPYEQIVLGEKDGRICGLRGRTPLGRKPDFSRVPGTHS